MFLDTPLPQATSSRGGGRGFDEAASVGQAQIGQHMLVEPSAGHLLRKCVG